jgi:hypothetical protein
MVREREDKGGDGTCIQLVKTGAAATAAATAAAAAALEQ